MSQRESERWRDSETVEVRGIERGERDRERCRRMDRNTNMQTRNN